jgi:hypothetical protein
MAIYYILLLGLTAIGVPLCRKRANEKTQILLIKIYLAVAFFALFVPAAIRSSTGFDYNLYAGIYYELNFQDYYEIMNSDWEKAFAVPLKILTIAFPTDWQPMFVLIALVCTIGVITYIYKNSNIAYVSVASFIALGLYYNSMNFMRQFIAAIIISFALNCIVSKQPLRFLVLVFFASCFHVSALIILPFYFILRIGLNSTILCTYSVIAVLTYVFSVPIAEFFTQYVYTSYDPLTSWHMTTGLPLGSFIIMALLLIPFCLFRKALTGKRPLNSVLINAYFFAVYFGFLGLKHSVLSRFALLFMIAPILALIPDLLIVINEKIKTKNIENMRRARFLSVVTAAAFALYGLTVNTVLLINDNNGVVPYRTIYESREVEEQ